MGLRKQALFSVGFRPVPSSLFPLILDYQIAVITRDHGAASSHRNK